MASQALGPHVVGSRVVVRSIVPGELGPTGGPAFTDVLGVCTAWGDGVCVLQPSGGEPVRIPTDLIVSGKPVPERPSVRHRVSVREAEGHVASLWPTLEVVPLGGWQLRIDPAPGTRLVKRANSVLAVGDPGPDLAVASAQVEEFYRARGRTPLAHVEAGSEVESQLLALGWTALDRGESRFELASLAAVRRSFGAPRSHADADAPRLTADGERAHASIGEVARGEAVLDGDWLGIHNLSVAPEHRRTGLARRVLAELLAWGGEQGALTVWLHVETDNAPALALYDSLAFRTHHTMRYLTAPGAEAPTRGA